MTDKQILILNQFFDDIIICFDGDESGYKAALRAAENSIKELQPEKQISFLFLPDGEDPDSYANKNGKQILLILQNKVRFQFINLYLIIIKAKPVTIHHLWQFLKKN